MEMLLICWNLHGTVVTIDIVLYCISSVILLMFITICFAEIMIKVGSRHRLIGRIFFSLLHVGAILMRSHFGDPPPVEE